MIRMSGVVAPAITHRNRRPAPLRIGYNVGVQAPETITCVDCGGMCHLISYSDPDEGFRPGDVAAYRCRDCNDRWDIVLGDEDDI